MLTVADDGDNTNQQKSFKELETKRKDAVSVSWKARNQKLSDIQSSRSYEQKKAIQDTATKTKNLRSAMTGATEQSKEEKVELCCGLEGGCGRYTHKDDTIILSTHQYYHPGNILTHKGLYVVTKKCLATLENGLQCVNNLIPVDEETEYITTGQLRYDVAKHQDD